MAGDELTLNDAGYVGEGRFNSPLPDYPGYVVFSYPFVGRHYKAWLKATRDKGTADDPLDSLTAFAEWRGAVALVQEWAIDGVPKSDVTPDGAVVPVLVMSWLRVAASLYLAGHFDPKAWPGVSGTTS